MYVSEHRLVWSKNSVENYCRKKPGQRVKDLIKWAKNILATYGDDEEKV